MLSRSHRQRYIIEGSLVLYYARNCLRREKSLSPREKAWWFFSKSVTRYDRQKQSVRNLKETALKQIEQ